MAVRSHCSRMSFCGVIACRALAVFALFCAFPLFAKFLLSIKASFQDTLLVATPEDWGRAPDGWLACSHTPIAESTDRLLLAVVVPQSEQS